jgi:hypothetical protein
MLRLRTTKKMMMMRTNEMAIERGRKEDFGSEERRKGSH